MNRLSRFANAIAAIDEELRKGNHRGLDAERLQFSRWVLTTGDDEIDELIGELLADNRWEPEPSGGC
jgi:hypothetical protein